MRLTQERVYGPPGTGKTTVIAKMVEEACRTYGSDRVVVASFTRAAARELSGRNLPLDAAQVGTLHSLCYRALGAPGLFAGPKVVKEFNQAQLNYSIGKNEHALDDLEFPGFVPTDESGDHCLAKYHILRHTMTPRRQWPTSARRFAEVYERFKEERGLLDFTDLIEGCRRDTVSPPNDPAIIFIDEGQDFSALELALVWTWAGSMERLVLAGDDDQCLYSFKGATPEAFLDPTIATERKRVLSQSYRIPRAVHAVATRLIKRVQRRQPKDYQPRDFEGEVKAMRRPWTWQYPDVLLDDLMQHVDAGKTVMVLASASYFLRPLLRFLRERGIAFANPFCRTRGDWNPLDSKGSTLTHAQRLLAFLKPSCDPNAWWSYSELYAWASILDGEGLLAPFAKMQMRELAERQAAAPVSDEDLDRWFIGEGVAGPALSGDLSWLRKNLLYAKRKEMDYVLRVVEQSTVKAIRVSPRLIVGTIHSVKGGEADIVYLLPDLSPSAAAAYYGNGRDAVIRCFYVGLTRAREAVYWGQPCGPAFDALYC